MRVGLALMAQTIRLARRQPLAQMSQPGLRMSDFFGNSEIWGIALEIGLNNPGYWDHPAFPAIWNWSLLEEKVFHSCLMTESLLFCQPGRL
jgi:hypothetical protein